MALVIKNPLANGGDKRHKFNPWVRMTPWSRKWHPTPVFPCGSAGKESTCNVRDLGLIPGLGRSPGEGKGYPSQYSGLENSMDYVVHGVAKSQTWLSNFHFPVFLPEKFHGQRSLAGYSPWSCKESNTTEHITCIHEHIHMCAYVHTHTYLSVKQFKYYTKIIRVLSAIYLPNCYGKQSPSFHHILSITSSLQAVFFTK